MLASGSGASGTDDEAIILLLTQNLTTEVLVVERVRVNSVRVND